MDVETFYCMYVEHDCDEATCPYYKVRCAFEDHWDSESENEWINIEKAIERERMTKNGRSSAGD